MHVGVFLSENLICGPNSNTLCYLSIMIRRRKKKSALILMWKIALTSPPTQLSARFRNQQRFYLNCRVKFFEGKIFVWKVLRSFKMWIRVWRKKDCDIFYSFVVTLPSDDNISLLRKKSEETWILKPIWKKDG